MDWIRCRRLGVVKEACHNTEVGDCRVCGELLVVCGQV